MPLNFKEIFTVFMVLFAVIDIVGNIPIVIDLRKKVGHIQSEKALFLKKLLRKIFCVICLHAKARAVLMAKQEHH